MRNLFFLCLVILILSVSGALAQIPNAGFETWTGTEPDGWVTSNTILGNTITKSSTAHSGSSSARGEVIPITTAVIQPVLQSGPGGAGFAFTERAAVFTGYYQFYPVGGDRFAINVILYVGGSGGTPVAIAAAALPTTVSSWTQFSVPFDYLTGDTPDICIIQIQIVGPVSTPHSGSYFLLDDLSLSGTTGVAESATSQPLTFQLRQNYPNPFNPATTIEFTLPSRTLTRLVVYNTLGQEVAQILNNEMEPGLHSVTFNGDGLPSGIYYYRLSAGTNTRIGKMSLLK